MLRGVLYQQFRYIADELVFRETRCLARANIDSHIDAHPLFGVSSAYGIYGNVPVSIRPKIPPKIRV